MLQPSGSWTVRPSSIINSQKLEDKLLIYVSFILKKFILIFLKVWNCLICMYLCVRLSFCVYCHYSKTWTVIQGVHWCFVVQVVGGMTWCIETCNFDVDVDLLFQENLTIGQKMYVTILFLINCTYCHVAAPYHALYNCRQQKKHVHKYMHVQYNMKCPVEMCTAWCDPYQQLNYGTISLRVIP